MPNYWGTTYLGCYSKFTKWPQYYFTACVWELLQFLSHCYRSISCCHDSGETPNYRGSYLLWLCALLLACSWSRNSIYDMPTMKLNGTWFERKWSFGSSRLGAPQPNDCQHEWSISENDMFIWFYWLKINHIFCWQEKIHWWHIWCKEVIQVDLLAH